MDASARIVAFVGARNPARAKEFYHGTLGLNLTGEDQFALTFDVQGTMLRVSTVPELTPAKFTVLGWEVKDIATAVRRGRLAARPDILERLLGTLFDLEAIHRDEHWLFSCTLAVGRTHA